ncbi:MAG: hypothetical protein Q4A12_05255 [Eubacteriales bacterium]|nr:hypothetical protein [Eubacteriales bacterium]
MRKVKLFGNNIEVSCNYCAHSQINNGNQFCTKNKVLKKGKCRKYEYNPFMREPTRTNALQKFKPEDFEL